MPINKFTTLLDLARQAKIITGETATFDGKIQVGIPFSGYPTGVDTGTTVSLGVVSSEDAVFSGNSGTTIFDVANTGSTNYSPIFSGYSGSVWTNVLFSGNTSGLTLPITPLSADTQVVGPFWTLTQTGMTGDYVIGTQYTGYTITYSFFNVSQIGTGFTYSGFTTATQENLSAGTLDYKGPLDYISTKEDASVEGRLTTNKLTVTGGASSATTGYVLTQTGDTGEVGWVFNSASGTTDTNLANTNLTQSAGTRSYKLPAGGRLGFTDNSNLTMLQFDESGPSLVVNNGLNSTDFHVKGQTDINTFYVVAATDSVGIGTQIPTEKLHVEGGDILVSDTNSRFYTDIQNPVEGPFTILSGVTTGLTSSKISSPSSGEISIGVRGASDLSYPVYGKQSDSFVYSSIVNNGINIISQPGTGTDDYIRFFAGQAAGAGGTPDLYIQGSGSTKGNVGINTDSPTEKLHVNGNTKISGSLNIGTILSGSPLINLGLDSIGNVVTGTTGGGTFTGNTSGDCINDIFVKNIHSCSPLNINPLDEGNVYFGSSSGVTINFLPKVVVGVGTNTPTESLHIDSGNLLIENSGLFRTDLTNSSGPLVVLSGESTDLSRFGVVTPTYDSVTFGIRGGSEPTFTGYGKQGDGFIYSSAQNNGFNIVSEPGTGTDDYIRFFAGRAGGAANTPDLHIQGSGTTGSVLRGNVGINNGDPTSKLDISGTTGYQQLRLRNSYTPTTSGDTNGEIGDISWDDNYIYVKTNSGWGRSSLDYGF